MIEENSVLDPQIEAQVSRGRAVLFKFLSRCFSRPDEEFARDFLSGALNRLIQDTISFHPDDDLTSFTPDAHSLSLSVKECWLHLEVEYNRLFVGPHRPIAPPFEYFYRMDVSPEQRGLLLGSNAVFTHYEQTGVTLNPEYHDMADHASVELDFMGTLSTWEADSWDEKECQTAQRFRTSQQLFFQEHLHWFQEFAPVVREASQISLYRAAAWLLELVLEAEADALDIQ